MKKKIKSLIKKFLVKHSQIYWGKTSIQQIPFVKITIFGMTVGKMQWDNIRHKWINYKKRHT